MNMQTFGRFRPKPGTKTGRVWDIADLVSRETGRKATRQEVVERVVASGGNEGTASTQYHEWQKAYDQAAAGFAEQPPARSSDRQAVQIGSDGRLLVPLDLRRLMMIGDDGKLTAQVIDGELRIISPACAVKRMQELARAQDTGTGSVVDELIAERRLEAGRE